MMIQNIEVNKVSSEKLLSFLDIKLNTNEKLSVDSFATYQNIYAITPDCVFWDLEKGHVKNKIETVIDIDCRIKRFSKDGSYSIRMDKPDFIKRIPINDLNEIVEKVKLIDFIRYNYNQRIISNQKLLMKYIKNSTHE